MTYIYDILLNFNEKLIEYFEWDESDKIKYIKKIVLFKINSKSLREIINNEVVFSDDFLKKVPKYQMNGSFDSLKICLFTDGFLVVGVLFKKNRVVLYSRMLCDEEKETLEISDNLDFIDVDYEIIKKRDNSFDYLTRKEKSVKEKLDSFFDNYYFNKKYDILFYLYYEYFNSECNNIDEVYKSLKNSLNDFNNYHLNLFDIISISNAHVN